MKPGKVLCCMFLSAILWFEPAQTLAKYKRLLHVFKQPTKRSIKIMYFMHSLSIKQQIIKVKDLPTGIFACLFHSLMFSRPLNHSLHYCLHSRLCTTCMKAAHGLIDQYLAI